MKPRPLVTHLLAALLGAGIWAGGRNATSEPAPERTSEAARLGDRRHSAPDDLIQSRLRKAIAEEKQQQDQWTKTTLREAGLEAIKENLEHLAEEAETYQRLRLRADGFRQTEDLEPVLYQALVDEDKELAAALFLEWHRRDPAEAFRQLEIREDFRDVISWIEPIHHAISTEEIVDIVTSKTCSDDLSYFLLSGHITHLADRDNLPELVTLTAKLTPGQQSQVIAQFVAAWIPDDGEEAARFLTQEIPENIALSFFSEFDGEGINNPFWSHFSNSPSAAWTDDFTQALLNRDLGPHESIRANLISNAERLDQPLGDDFYHSKGDAHYRITEPDRSDSVANNASHAIAQDLFHDRDYPELLVRGEISLPEIREAMLVNNPGLEHHPQELDAALLQQLFVYTPDQAVAWASDRLDSATLAETLGDSLDNHFDEPRAARSEAVISAIPAGLVSASETLELETKKHHTRVAEWHQLVGAQPPRDDP